jgi:hypothetical protein
MPYFTGPSGKTYEFAGDLSAVRARTEQFYTSTTAEIEIPLEDIRALYLHALRQQEIAALGRASTDELEARFLNPRSAPEVKPVLPGWTADALAAREIFRVQVTGIQDVKPKQPTVELTVGGIYVHKENPGILAKITELPPAGHVLFSVWDADYPWAWSPGAGLPDHPQFRSLYRTVYPGPDPVPSNGE